MSDLEKKNKANEQEAWNNVMDKVIEFISTSKSTLRILNEKQGITDEKKAEAAQQNAKEVIRRKLIKEFLKGTVTDGDKVTELHINEAFTERSESKVRCSTVYNEEQYQQSKEPSKHRNMNFLDEQYNLTKQAIARRYRPQIKINTFSSKNSSIREYLSEPFNEEVHRISNVASENLPVSHLRKKHIKKTQMIAPEILSAENAQIIYEKF